MWQQGTETSSHTCASIKKLVFILISLKLESFFFFLISNFSILFLHLFEVQAFLKTFLIQCFSAFYYTSNMFVSSSHFVPSLGSLNRNHSLDFCECLSDFDSYCILNTCDKIHLCWVNTFNALLQFFPLSLSILVFLSFCWSYEFALPLSLSETISLL